MSAWSRPLTSTWGGGAENCLYDGNVWKCAKGSELKTQTHLCFLLHQQNHPDAVWVSLSTLRWFLRSFLPRPFHFVCAALVSTRPLFSDPFFTRKRRCQPHLNSPAFMRLLALTSERGHAEGRWGGWFTCSNCWWTGQKRSLCHL